MNKKTADRLARYALVECGKTIAYEQEKERTKLRDFFAGCALASTPHVVMSAAGTPLHLSDTKRTERAFKTADVMMEEREK